MITLEVTNSYIKILEVAEEPIIIFNDTVISLVKASTTNTFFNDSVDHI